MAKIDGSLGDGIALILGEKRYATSAKVFRSSKASDIVPSNSHSIKRPGGCLPDFRHRRRSSNVHLFGRENLSINIAGSRWIVKN